MFCLALNIKVFILKLIVHQLESGLFIAKLKLKSHDGVSTACIGGPHGSFSAFLEQCGDMAKMVACFINGLEKFRKLGAPSLPSPIMSIEDHDFALECNKTELNDITGEPKVDRKKAAPKIVNDADEVKSTIVSTAGFTLICSKCGVDVEEDVRDLHDEVKAIVGEPRVKAVAAFVNEPDKKLNDLKTLIKIMEQGINLEYRCQKCRDCWSCRNSNETERISVREEQEDEAIRN